MSEKWQRARSPRILALIPAKKQSLWRVLCRELKRTDSCLKMITLTPVFKILLEIRVQAE